MTTPIIGLDEIASDQVSKDITHNNALRALEGVLIRVLSATTTAEPGSPANGDAYIIPASATGTDWATYSQDDIAVYNEGWYNFTPGHGWRVWIEDDNYYAFFDDSNSKWTPLVLGSESGITASTTQTQGQQPLTKMVNEISTCANANDVVTAPNLLGGMHFTVINNGAATLDVFPASGEDLGGGTDTAVSIAPGSAAMWVCYTDGTGYQLV